MIYIQGRARWIQEEFFLIDGFEDHESMMILDKQTLQIIHKEGEFQRVISASIAITKKSNKTWDSMPSSASCLSRGPQVCAGFQAATSPL